MCVGSRRAVALHYSPLTLFATHSLVTPFTRSSLRSPPPTSLAPTLLTDEPHSRHAGGRGGTRVRKSGCFPTASGQPRGEPSPSPGEPGAPPLRERVPRGRPPAVLHRVLLRQPHDGHAGCSHESSERAKPRHRPAGRHHLHDLRRRGAFHH